MLKAFLSLSVLVFSLYIYFHTLYTCIYIHLSWLDIWADNSGNKSACIDVDKYCDRPCLKSEKGYIKKQGFHYFTRVTYTCNRMSFYFIQLFVNKVDVPSSCTDAKRDTKDGIRVSLDLQVIKHVHKLESKDLSEREII